MISMSYLKFSVLWFILINFMCILYIAFIYCIYIFIYNLYTPKFVYIFAYFSNFSKHHIPENQYLSLILIYQSEAMGSKLSSAPMNTLIFIPILTSFLVLSLKRHLSSYVRYIHLLFWVPAPLASLILYYPPHLIATYWAIPVLLALCLKYVSYLNIWLLCIK